VRSRVAATGIGVVFGITLCWSGMSNPDVIREALLFQRAYLFLMFASAVLVAVVGQRLLRRRRAHALLTGAPLTFERERPGRRHVTGSVLFGLGWGIADACPGPIAAQVGQGVPWALFTIAGVFAGVYLFLRRGTPETEPPADAAPVTFAAAYEPRLAPRA
jgi:uncharacterized membrane protein YedE/YeeE